MANDSGDLLGPLDASEVRILFLTLDTTRADHLGCYGYGDVQTPNMDRLAETGVLFRQAFCQTPLTLPSHSSIFTGTYPFYHGVRDNGGFYLDEDQVTLAEVLQRRSYATAAFIGAFVLDSRWGLNQGFEYYYDDFDFSTERKPHLDTVQREGGEVINAFFEWLEENYQRSFFSWIHFYDPHTPYDPPEPYKGKYADAPYDGEIAYVDSLIGRVLDRLKARGILDKTLIVLVGDHGESLGEHEESGHGYFIYDSTVRVPLIIRFPAANSGGKQVTTPVETIDIMPTLLQVLDLPVPSRVQGKSLLPVILGEDQEQERFTYSETYFSQYRYGWSALMSLRSSQHKYIEAPRPELYNLIHDPEERDNIYEEDLETGKEFQERLRRLQEEKGAKSAEGKAPEELDEESKERLMALGYVAGLHYSSNQNKVEGPIDPKDKILLFNRIKLAEEFFAEGRFDEALEEISNVIEGDSTIPQALQVRAQIYLRQNKIQAAIEDCEEALKADPGDQAALFTLAHARKVQKEYEQAIAAYKGLMRLDPRDYKPPLNLGRIYLEMKRVDDAVSYLKQSISLDPERSAMAHNLLGVAYIEKGMLVQAEQEIKEALELRPQISDARYNLALLYERKGNLDEAIEQLRKEIEVNPASYRTHFHLANLFEQLGNEDEKIRHLEEVIKYKEDFANGYLMLAKTYLDLDRNLDEAMRYAKRGLELAPESEYAPFGHYVLADIYNRLGQTDKFHEEMNKGRQLEQKLKR